MLIIVIKDSAPAAKEKISYQMPTFELHGNLVQKCRCGKFTLQSEKT